MLLKANLEKFNKNTFVLLKRLKIPMTPDTPFVYFMVNRLNPKKSSVPSSYKRKKDAVLISIFKVLYYFKVHLIFFFFFDFPNTVQDTAYLLLNIYTFLNRARRNGNQVSDKFVDKISAIFGSYAKHIKKVCKTFICVIWQMGNIQYHYS